MELLYLLGSLLKAAAISLLLSLHLLCTKLLFSKISTSADADDKTHNNADDEEENLVLYEGKVWHERTQPLVHRFEYPVRYALIDLTNPPSWILQIINKHHMNAAQAKAIAGTNGPVYLLTMPTSVGYEQNPLSVYYCYDTEGSTRFLRKCIAEVTNTPWGERVSFVFYPNSDLVAKPLHVSPFMDMLGNWKMHANLPGRSLSLTILVQHPEFGNYFTATLRAHKVQRLRMSPEIFLWLMPQKVAVWIYWQAFLLWWKGVRPVPHPKYANGKGYREEALNRARQLQFKLADGKCETSCKRGIHEMNSEKLVTCSNESEWWCVWRDAEWPWS